MLNTIWAGMIFVSFFCACVTGRMDTLSGAIFQGGTQAVELVLSISGTMALWTGFLKIAEAGGITHWLSKTLQPFLGHILPDHKEDPPALEAVSMNITANLLGLGNAATPTGIAAMKAMAKHSPARASNSMVRFVVLNTASIQLIPTMLASLRASAGSAAPLEILPAVWCTSLTALLTGLAATKLLEHFYG